MNQKLHREIGHQRRLEILTALKRHGGMSVKEVAAHFGVSYMGIKQHCLDLERDGYLSTWRQPKGMGRPELIYRLTLRAHELFPGASHPFTAEILEAVQQTYGPAAPTKLLFAVFAQRGESYRMQINHCPTLAERAERLARLRDAEGYMAEFHAAPGDAAHPAGGLWIIEHHSPIEDLLRRYPILARLERELFERALNSPVQREEQSGESGYRCLFYLGDASA
jgi:predicted ArsR family transcriptional regulator